MAPPPRQRRPAWIVVGLVTSLLVATGALVGAMTMRHDGASTGSPTIVATDPAGDGSAMGEMEHPNGAMPMSGTEVPDYELMNANLEQQYGFAMQHGDLMSYMPCVCGCGSSVGHLSLWNCYVKSIGPDGKVVFDEHATGCQICQDLTRDVMAMHERGSPPSQIRRYLDQHYAGEQTPTDRPPVV